MSFVYEFPILIVDIDGTVRDTNHRMHLRGEWEAYNEAAKFDPADEAVVKFLRRMEEAYTIIGITTTKFDLRSTVFDWIASKGLSLLFDEVIFSNSGFGDDAEQKIDTLETHFGGKDGVIQQVALVLEGRPKTVAALREYGLTVFQTR